LIEWKKIRFMEDRVGEDFGGIILSCTKYGFFVELDELFIEGMVPIASLQDDRYFFRDTDRTIVGARNGRIFKIGQHVHVLLDRIDRQQRRLQFALMPSMYEETGAPRSLRRSKKATVSEEKTSPDRSGKPKRKGKAVKRDRNRKAKGKPRR
jgi:ribonuclease R